MKKVFQILGFSLLGIFLFALVCCALIRPQTINDEFLNKAIRYYPYTHVVGVCTKVTEENGEIKLSVIAKSGENIEIKIHKDNKFQWVDEENAYISGLANIK